MDEPHKSCLNEAQREAVAARIDYLRKSGSSDWKGLSDQIAAEAIDIKLNLPQLLTQRVIHEKQELYGIMSRATGKTTMLGTHVDECAHQMPRSSGALIGPSYRKLLGQILPSLKHGLEIVGLFEGVHYFVGKPPPKSWKWPKPWHAPNGFGKVVYFYTGAVMHLISHDVKDDGRGLNLDWVVSDEAGLLLVSEIEQNILPALRGSNASAYRNASLLGTQLHLTSMPLTLRGEWIIQKKEQSRRTPDEVGFIMADVRYNLHNLIDGYLARAERSATARWVYLAEYWNVRPNKVDDQFYADLKEAVHGYHATDYEHYSQVGQPETSRADADVDREKGLMFCVDWGVNINCGVTCQEDRRGKHIELRALKEFAALGKDEENQQHLAAKFSEYYDDHPVKTVYLYYDQTGNVRTGMTKRTRAQEFAKQLCGLGWTVQLMTTGMVNPSHAQKHELWKMILQEVHGYRKLGRFRINLDNCPNLWISMTHAPAKKSSKGEIQKDKRSERKEGVEAVHATHFSDAMDQGPWGLYQDILRWGDSGGGMLPG